MVDEASIIALMLARGWTAEVARGDGAAAEREARQILDRLVSQGLGFQRSPSGERCFDAGEVLNFSLQLGLEGNDPFWPDHVFPTGRRRVWAAHGLSPRQGACPPPTALGSRRFVVRLSRLFNLDGREPGSQLRLRLPLPIEDETLSDLHLRILPGAGVEADFTIGEARLDAQITVPADLRVELGFEATFTAHAGGHGSSAPLDPGSTALYTRPREGLIQVTDSIRSLAAEIADGERDAWAQVQAFWNFMWDHLRLGVVNYDEVDAARPNDWILQNGWSDCQLASALLVALCRARDIPARMISGYVLDDDAPFYHCWAEVWVPERGWLPVDTESWYFSAGGRDPLWRDYYLGQLDYRMKTESLPRLFNSGGSVRLPKAWRLLVRMEGGGLESTFQAVATRAFIYRDRVAIVGGDGPPPLSVSRS